MVEILFLVYSNIIDYIKNKIHQLKQFYLDIKIICFIFVETFIQHIYIAQ